MTGNETAIERAVRLAGGQTDLAGRIGVRPQAVQKWVSAGKVPVDRVFDVERAVHGAVTREDLRPDIFCVPPFEHVNSAAKVDAHINNPD